jgi:hypothetical protein
MFRWLVSTIHNGPSSPDLSDELAKVYYEGRRAWNRLFPNWIPVNYRDWGDRRAFAEDNNPDAMADWEFALSRLATMDTGLGISTGFPALDALSAGYHDLVLLAGPTGSGKTTILLHGALNALRADPGLAVLVVSTELSKSAWLTKLMSCASGLGHDQIVQPGPGRPMRAQLDPDVKGLVEVLPRLKAVTRLYESSGADEDGPRYVPTSRILVRTGDALLEHSGASRLLVIVDSLDYTPFYVRDVGGREREVRSGPNDLAADVIKLRALREVTKYYNHARPLAAVVATTRVSSKGDQGGRLGLADVRGSSDLVFEPDQVLTIQRVGPEQPGVTPTVVRVLKTRHVGSEGEVPFEHHHRLSRFVEVSGRGASLQSAAGPAQPFAL